jgi:hypothetical protein
MRPGCGCRGVFLLRHERRSLEKLAVDVCRLPLQDKAGLFHGLVRFLHQQENLPQFILGLQVGGIDFHRLAEIAVRPLQVALFHLHHSHHVKRVAELGINLQGIPEFQAGLDIVSLLVQGLPLAEELGLLRIGSAAPDCQRHAQTSQE